MSTPKDWQRRIARYCAFVFVCWGSGILTAPVADAAAEPTVTPIAANAGQYGFAFNALTFASASGFVNPVNLSAAGYAESEFLITGTANTYKAAGTWGADGNWSVTLGAPQPYATRVLVRTPPAGKFNGVIVVEWLNVTAGYDADADFAQAYTELLRGGYAWVGVSAQAAGVSALTKWDASRYPALSVGSDSLSYDIFSQAAQAIRDQSGVLLGGLTPSKLIASGHGQAAARLVTYTNAIQPLTHSFDGFMIHSRVAKAAPLGSGAFLFRPATVLIRADNDTPVFQLESEAEVVSKNYLAIRQADTPLLRTWEVAGASNTDIYADTVLNVEFEHQFPTESAPVCQQPINNFPMHYAEQSAWSWLRQWVTAGTAPPSGAPIAIDASGQIVRDGFGNAQGGVRLPDLDVSIATYGITNTYARNTGSLSARHSRQLCQSLGNTAPLTTSQLLVLYPSHSAYVAQYTTAAGTAQAAGVILPADASAAISAAKLRNIPPS